MSLHILLNQDTLEKIKAGVSRINRRYVGISGLYYAKGAIEGHPFWDGVGKYGLFVVVLYQKKILLQGNGRDVDTSFRRQGGKTIKVREG